MKKLMIGLVAAGFAFAAQATTFKLSTAYPDGTAAVNELKAAAKAIRTQTEDRVKFKIYAGGVQGDDNTVFRKIRTGQLHGALVQGGAVARFYKDSQVYNAPLAFRSYDEVDYVRERMDKGIAQGLDQAGWVSFGLIDGGFAYTMTNNPVNNVDDLRKQKLWLPANDPASEKASEAFDLSPIVLNIGEVLTSLQTGAIDAIAAPPVAALTLQWYSRVKYMTDVPLLYTYALLTVNKKHFSKLSAEDQAIVRAEFGKAIAKLDEVNRKDNLKSFDAMSQQGIEIVSPNETDRAQWNDYAVKATANLVQKDEFSQAILDEMNGYLTEFRSKN